MRSTFTAANLEPKCNAGGFMTCPLNPESRSLTLQKSLVQYHDYASLVAIVAEQRRGLSLHQKCRSHEEC